MPISNNLNIKYNLIICVTQIAYLNKSLTTNSNNHMKKKKESTDNKK